MKDNKDTSQTHISEPSSSKSSDVSVSEEAQSQTETEVRAQPNQEQSGGNRSDQKQSELSEAMRDEALSAAEKGLEAARAALEVAEKKLAEAKLNASAAKAEKENAPQSIPVEASEAASSVSTENQACQPSQSPSQTIPEVFQTEAPSGYPANQAVYAAPTSPVQDAQTQSVYTQPTTQATQPQPVAPTYVPPQPYATTSQPAAQAYVAQAQPATTQTYTQSGEQAYQATSNAQSYAAYGSAAQVGSYQTGQANTYQANTYQASSPNTQQPPVQPHYAPPVASRDHVAAGLLAIFLGFFGIHKFYLGYNTQGFILLAIGLIGGVLSFGLALGIVWIIALIEGIIYLTKSQSEFERIYVYTKREWF